ncbi:MAG: C25 family cysteine peptidase [candidate division WOR-3 bacterium]|nr:C25 family cysteine peptidase [candidate division WOR-3 bacterium]
MKKFIFCIFILMLGAQAQEIGAKYLIITHDNFYNDIQPLAQWKHKKGMRTKVVKFSEIGTTSTQIKSYITYGFNNWQIRPEFVLLVGSPDLIPWGQTYPYTYSDHPYMNMNTDIYNEILLGRLTVHNTTEAQTVVNKILLYERTPYMGDTAWMRNACLIVAEDGLTYPPVPGTDDYIYWGDSRHAYNLMLANGYNRMDTLSTLLGDNYNDVIQSVNNGVGFVQFRGQGVGNWWGPFGVNPDNTANGSMLPIVLSITCSTIGTGSTPATAERWLLTGTPTTPRGASGYFATTTVRSHVAQIRSAVARGFFTAIFTNGQRTFGEACEGGRLNLYNLYSDTQDYQGFATLGDPEMNIWTATPRSIDVAHVPSLAAEDETLLVTVTLSNGGPIDSALVCAVLDTTVYSYGITDNNGQIVLQLPTMHPGQMDITVTGRNLIPHEGTIEIVGDNAYLQYQSHILNDSLGNNNGIPENGETILLTATIANIGLMAATGVSATLRSDDEFVSIIDSVSYYGDIQPQDSASNISPYAIAISNICPDGHIAVLRLLMTDSGSNEWISNFSIIITNTASGTWVGPDEYGYYIYDDTDTLTGYAPTFDWYDGTMAIVPEISDEDADTVTYSLPFTFPFYGLSYNAVGMCSNGFLEMGVSTHRFGVNTQIPAAGGPRRLLAAFWDDLDPTVDSGSGDVYYAYDTTNHRYIVEFRSIGHWGTVPQTQRETFQVQLLDPQYYTTPTGDGEILFLYDTVMNASSNTVGIEDHTETRGLQYVYNNSYHPNAAPLQNGRALLITTKTPAGIWLHTVDFSFEDSTGGNNNGIIDPGETIQIYLQLMNSGNAAANNVTTILRTGDPDASITDSTAEFGLISQGSVAANYGDPYVVEISTTPSDTTIGFVLYISCNSGAYHKSDYFTFYLYGSPGVEEQKTGMLGVVSLNICPNPFKLSTDINYTIPYAGYATHENATLKIYDVTGRMVKDFSGLLSANAYQSSISWDGTDDIGRRVANGIYFIALDSQGIKERAKVILVK